MPHYCHTLIFSIINGKVNHFPYASKKFKMSFPFLEEIVRSRLLQFIPVLMELISI